MDFFGHEIRVSRTSLFFGGVLGIMLGDFGGLFVAVVEIETITQRQSSARRNGVITGMRLVLEAFEVVLAKGIRAEKAVITHLPPGRVADILRVVEDGHAVSPAVVF